MKEKFQEILKEALEADDIQLSFNDVLSDIDTWDSMSRLSLIALLDEHFEVEVSDDEFDEVETIQDLYELVKSKMK